MAHKEKGEQPVWTNFRFCINANFNIYKSVSRYPHCFYACNLQSQAVLLALIRLCDHLEGTVADFDMFSRDVDPKINYFACREYITSCTDGRISVINDNRLILFFVRCLRSYLLEAKNLYDFSGSNKQSKHLMHNCKAKHPSITATMKCPSASLLLHSCIALIIPLIHSQRSAKITSSTKKP
ncbi:hypothetical protein BD560DRAFT_490283 [Blakeslea trispora]|nr:hypothetical protein BD560DRAFT_490283 [Blakeslea trispora]